MRRSICGKSERIGKVVIRVTLGEWSRYSLLVLEKGTNCCLLPYLESVKTDSIGGRKERQEPKAQGRETHILQNPSLYP